jgi:hypothetical protein
MNGNDGDSKFGPDRPQGSLLDALFGSGGDDNDQRKKRNHGSGLLFDDDEKKKQLSPLFSSHNNDANHHKKRLRCHPTAAQTTSGDSTTTTAAAADDNNAADTTTTTILRLRTARSQHPQVQDLIVERRDHEPIEAFCEEVASTVRQYGVAIARNCVVPGVVEGEDETNETTTTEKTTAVALLDSWARKASRQRQKICTALSTRHLSWNENCNNNDDHIVRFQEVVVRCKGRMDVLYNEDDDELKEMEEVEDGDKAEEENAIPFWPSHAILNGIVNQLLYGGGGGGGGTDDQLQRPRLVYAGYIFSEPGSADQPFHQDGLPLFPVGNETLPPYAINVFVPLQDTTIELGPTEFILHSHRLPPTALSSVLEASSTASLSSSSASSLSVVAPLPQRGDLLFYDYRVCHRGTSNLCTGNDDNDQHLRSVLYLLYARPWFREHVNFGTERLLVS